MRCAMTGFFFWLVFICYLFVWPLTRKRSCVSWLVPTDGHDETGESKNMLLFACYAYCICELCSFMLQYSLVVFEYFKFLFLLSTSVSRFSALWQSEDGFCAQNIKQSWFFKNLCYEVSCLCKHSSWCVYVCYVLGINLKKL